MAPIVHPGRLLKRELAARKLSANRLSLDIGVPSGRITDILNGRRAITADTAVRLGRYFGNTAQFWLDLQGQYDIGVVEREKGAEIARRVRPADAASPKQSRRAAVVAPTVPIGRTDWSEQNASSSFRSLEHDAVNRCQIWNHFSRAA